MFGRTLLPGIVCFFLSAFGSLLLGFLIYGEQIFHSNLVYFQFTTAGIMGGALIVSIKEFGARSTLVVGIVGYAASLLMTRPSSEWLYFRDAVWIVGQVAAVLICLLNDRIFHRIIFGKFILWGAVFGAVNLGMVVVLFIFKGVSFDQISAFKAMQLGVLIGGGIGFGYEVAELIKVRKWFFWGSIGPRKA